MRNIFIFPLFCISESNRYYTYIHRVRSGLERTLRCILIGNNFNLSCVTSKEDVLQSLCTEYSARPTNLKTLYVHLLFHLPHFHLQSDLATSQEGHQDSFIKTGSPPLYDTRIWREATIRPAVEYPRHSFTEVLQAEHLVSSWHFILINESSLFVTSISFHAADIGYCYRTLYYANDRVTNQYDPPKQIPLGI